MSKYDIYRRHDVNDFGAIARRETALRKALLEIRDAIMRADPTVLTDTLWMPEDVLKGATVVDRIDIALETAGVSSNQTAEKPLNWGNFEGLKINVEWKPFDQDLIYTAINYRDGEYGDADEDVGQQIVERLLSAWQLTAEGERLTFGVTARLLRERDAAREALKPFATVEPMDVYEGEDEACAGEYVLTQADFSRARKAMGVKL